MWSETISSHALMTLHTKKFNKPELLPLVEDVTKLSNHLKDKVEDLMKKDFTDPVHYCSLAKVCLAQVILFRVQIIGGPLSFSPLLQLKGPPKFIEWAFLAHQFPF